ncbi:MAG TPA: ankyrin repeat domain-containing protein, partial [Gammaproteobacteria bacterium]|nr:ankyrin repeat domain-containing protein [Gammaproteobacteria bacterium]
LAIKLFIKPWEFLFKAAEIACDRHGYTKLAHIPGMISSFIRYTFSFNPVQTARECAEPSARSTRVFTYLLGETWGPRLGGAFGFMLSMGGIFGVGFLAPAAIISAAGAVGESHAATVVTNGLAGVGISAPGAGLGFAITQVTAETVSKTIGGGSNTVITKQIDRTPKHKEHKIDVSYEKPISLKKAIAQNNLKMISKLVEQKASIEEKGSSLLIFAINKECTSETISTLIKAQADVSYQQNNGNFPLILAVVRSQSKTVKILLAAKAELNTQQRTSDGATALHLAVSMYISMEGNCPPKEIIQDLLSAKANPNVPSKKGETVIQLATGNTEIEELLTAAGWKKPESGIQKKPDPATNGSIFK